MKARRVLAGILAAVTLLASAGYVFVYLYRWEWNRALISGVIFLAAEIAVIGWWLHAKLVDVSRRIDDARTQRIARHLDDAREPSAVFEWLRPDPSRTSVFVPILMGAGLVLSGVAWVLEKVGQATAGRAANHRLAGNLSRMAPPAGGFLDTSADPLSDLRAPHGAPR